MFQGGNWQTLGSMPSDYYLRQQNVNAVGYAGSGLSGGLVANLAAPLSMVSESQGHASYTSAAALLTDHT